LLGLDLKDEQVSIGSKHALSPRIENSGHVAKRVRFDYPQNTERYATMSTTLSKPDDLVLGFKWDSKNWSCAYDSLFMILLNVFRRRDVSLDSGPHDSTAALRKLCEGFRLLRDGARSPHTVPELVRDTVRDLLEDNTLLPRHGEQATSLDHLIQKLFHVRDPFADVDLLCRHCQYTWAARHLASDYVLFASPLEFAREVLSSVSTTFIMHSMLTHSKIVACPVCRCEGVERRTSFLTYPAFFVVEVLTYVDNFPSLTVDMTVGLRPISAGLWSLAGIIYLDNCHFTSRYIDLDGRIWSHDGMSQSNIATLERNELNETIDLSKFGVRKACHLFYFPSNSTPNDRFQH
jgi:hypothetical protein